MQKIAWIPRKTHEKTGKKKLEKINQSLKEEHTEKAKKKAEEN